MARHSLIYKNIFVYRAFMNVLYGGKYHLRFKKVYEHIELLGENKALLELCFGDTQIAEYCRKSKVYWKGYDLNKSFVTHAISLGYEAEVQDITTIDKLPKADVVVMIGSLYHFHDSITSLFKKIFEAVPVFIISEPVKNFSSAGGIVGIIARRSANAGKGNEVFRYNRESLIYMLEKNRNDCNFGYEIIEEGGKDMIVKLKRSDYHIS